MTHKKLLQQMMLMLLFILVVPGLVLMFCYLSLYKTLTDLLSHSDMEVLERCHLAGLVLLASPRRAALQARADLRPALAPGGVAGRVGEAAQQRGGRASEVLRAQPVQPEQRVRQRPGRSAAGPLEQLRVLQLDAEGLADAEETEGPAAPVRILFLRRELGRQEARARHGLRA